MAMVWTGKGRTMGGYLYDALKILSRHAYNPKSFLKLARIVKYEGLKGVAKRLLIGMESSDPGLGRSIVLDDYKDPHAAYNIVPFYDNQQLDGETALIEDGRSTGYRGGRPVDRPRYWVRQLTFAADRYPRAPLADEADRWESGCLDPTR
jgi:hypothetical protein